eukprot:CAMPEP_0202695310 /NCGR_PEP_ID=MMETSP1385-20130828/8930_1 /ASSEMBLY_ACC=CAM_ASM_000861 /TAXON_ID=933848 /ORGANISM="Elphidium margaritaceum" /LENGTH=657 /DNA_ID=CAMNT_0049351313 /DNA_START=8 /DNA_END=1981 /DNA_ORIENTATION=-
MGNNNSANGQQGKAKASANGQRNTYNPADPLGRVASQRTSLTQKELDRKKLEEEEKKKEPEIPIDDLCKKELDPFFKHIDDEHDSFMTKQYEVDFSEINAYPTEDTSDNKYKVASWRGSKEFLAVKIYYDETQFKKKSKTALLVWCRAVTDGDNVRHIEVNLVDLYLKKYASGGSSSSNDDEEEEEEQKGMEENLKRYYNGLYFDPSDTEKSYKFKKRFVLPVEHRINNGSVKQLRLKCQLHPRRPLLFVFNRPNITQGITSLEVFNLESDGYKLRKMQGGGGMHYRPNVVLSFGNDHYLSNENLEQNNLHFVSKKLRNAMHEYVLLFHKPEIEQNISSGSKLVIFDLTEKLITATDVKFANNYNNTYYGGYNNNNNVTATSINFNTMVWNTLHVGQTYHHNLVDIFPRGIEDENISILFRIHHVTLLNQDNTPRPPQALQQLDPNSNFSFESYSELYYVNLNLSTRQLSDVTKNGFRSLQLSKTTLKESNCVDKVCFSQDGKFFAIIKQREFNDEALFRVYRTGETDKNNFLCQMTNIDIKPWMIQLRSHWSLKFGFFFTIHHINDDIEKDYLIVAGPNIYGDLQNYRQVLREWLYDDAISVIVSMIGLAHRYTLHLENVAELAGEQMADFDYNPYLDAMLFAVDDAPYMLWQTNY